MISNSGSGPGARTRDGCSVELYRRLPHRGEVDIFARELASGCHVLDLGCGTGRLTRELLARGFAVTAVDNSEDMLAEVPERGVFVFERQDPAWLAHATEGRVGGDHFDCFVDRVERRGRRWTWRCATAWASRNGRSNSPFASSTTRPSTGC